MRSLLASAMTGLLLLASAAGAQVGSGYDLSWSTVDGGGGSFSAATGFTVGGTVGQPDAGRAIGGPYAVAGGFWAATIPAVRCGDLNGDGLVNIGESRASSTSA